MVYLGVTLFVAIAVGGPVVALTRRLMGEPIDLLRSAIDSLKLASFIVGGVLGAALSAAIAGHFVWPHKRVRPWVLGFAASAGLWGAFSVLPPNGFQTMRDVYAMLIVWAVFGALFGYLMFRWQQQVDDNAP